MPSVREDDDVDLGDVDDYKKLSYYEKLLVLLEQVRQEHGPVSMDEICIAELYSYSWAIKRRRKLAAIHQARAYKKKHHLSHEGAGEESLARRGVKDANAAREWFAKCGIPVMEAVT